MTKSSTSKLRKSAYRLVLPKGESSPSAVRSFMLDCLVPLLAEEFLKWREQTTTMGIATKPRNPTTEQPSEQVRLSGSVTGTGW
jgi:hypothetical protein